MLNEKFQVFGIHIYLKEPTKLLCSSVKPEKTVPITTTKRIPVHTKRPPPRTLITVVDGDKRLQSDNYAYNSDTSSTNKLFSIQNSVLCLSFTVLLFLVNS